MRTVLALLTVMLLAAPVAAEVEVRIRYGHGQEAIAGAITPLVVEFTSRENEPVGVRIESRPGSTMGAGEVCRAVDLLSPSTTRRITLLYRPYTNTRPEVTLRFDRAVSVIHERERTPKPVREITLQPPKRPVERGSQAYSRFTVLTVGPGANQLPLPPDGLRVLPMEERDLPDVWHSYDGVDAVLLRRPAEARPIPPEKIRALLEYVEAGGRLVISTNRPERLGEMGLTPLLPATQSTEDVLDLTATEVAVPFAPRRAQAWGAAPGRHAIRVHRMDYRDDARVLALLPDVGWPLVVERNHGYGTIAMVAFDTARLRQLTEGRSLVTHAVIFGGWNTVRARKDMEELENELFPSVGFIMGGSVDDRPLTEILRLLRAGAIRPPPMGLLFLFMILYILAVGPIDYWILKKRNLLKWSALTFLGLAIVFSVSAWYVSFHLFAGSEKVNRVTFADVLPQGENQPDRVLVHDLTGHYAPVGRTLELRPEGETAHVSDFAEPSAYTGGGGLQRSPVELAFTSSVRATGQLVVPFRSLRTTQTVLTRRETFPLDVTFDRDRSQCTVRNGLPYPLNDVTLVQQGYQHEIGDIGPGEEKTAALRGRRLAYRSIESLLDSTREDLTRRQIRQAGQRLMPLTWARAAHLPSPDAEWSEHFRHLAKAGIDRSPALARDAVLVVAWTDAPDPFGLAHSDSDGFRLTILRKVVSP